MKQPAPASRRCTCLSQGNKWDCPCFDGSTLECTSSDLPPAPMPRPPRSSICWDCASWPCDELNVRDPSFWPTECTAYTLRPQTICNVCGKIVMDSYFGPEVCQCAKLMEEMDREAEGIPDRHSPQSQLNVDPLARLDVIAFSPGILRHDPDTISSILKEIVQAWKNERESHDISIDKLQDEIADLQTELDEREIQDNGETDG